MDIKDQQLELAAERTLLAAERTFSAWLRTGLAGVGGGLAIVHFLYFRNPIQRLTSEILGETLILWGIIIFIFSYISYKRTCQRLETMTGYKGHRTFVGIASLVVLVFSTIFLLITFHKTFDPLMSP